MKGYVVMKRNTSKKLKMCHYHTNSILLECEKDLVKVKTFSHYKDKLRRTFCVTVICCPTKTHNMVYSVPGPAEEIHGHHKNQLTI